MPTRRLLYLCAHRATAFCWRDGTLLEEAGFATTPAGQQQFAAYLEQHRESRFALLANVAEEGFQIERIPFLRGADRRAVIRRRIGQLFFNSKLSTSRSLGHEKARRRNERILLAALTDPSFIEPWVKRIGAAGIALSGIYSLPLLGAVLLEKIAWAQARCLLLTVQDQSIRQSYFEKGELHFSRLTPLQHSDHDAIARAFAAEAGKLQQYVAALHPDDTGQAISACILAHADTLPAIEATCIDSATLTFRIIEIEDCARRIGLKTPPPATHCESLFAHLLAAAPPRTQFADDGLRHDFHLQRIRSALHAFAATALVVSLLFAGKLAGDSHGIAQQAESLASKARHARLRYEAIAATFPSHPGGSAALLHAIDRYSELERKNRSPEGLLLAISRALPPTAALELESIAWQASAAPGDERELATVHGTLQPGANARLALAAFRQLNDALKANPQLQTKVLHHPFAGEAGQSLSGGSTRPEDEAPKTFSLQISRKAGS